MSIKPLFSTLVSLSSMLMLAGTAQAQGLFGGPFFTPYYAQPRYVSQQPVYSSPCGPNGCPTTMNSGYAPRSNCPGGVCNQPSYRYSSNYAPRSYSVVNGTCGPNGCSTGGCANGSCAPRCVNGQCFPSNGTQRTMPYDYGYPTQTRPLPPAPSREYLSNRPTYYYDEMPTRTTPPTYLDPRSNPYYGASRGDRNGYANVERPGAMFDSDRSPFYP